jgi:hypothetical protein
MFLYILHLGIWHVFMYEYEYTFVFLYTMYNQFNIIIIQ